MARRLSLRAIQFGEQQATYAEIMLEVLKFAPTPNGITLPQIIDAVEAMKPIEAAVAAKAPDVVLEEKQWLTLRQKVETFPFRFADAGLLEFGLHVRNAPEIGLEPPATPEATGCADDCTHPDHGHRK